MIAYFFLFGSGRMYVELTDIMLIETFSVLISSIAIFKKWVYTSTLFSIPFSQRDKDKADEIQWLSYLAALTVAAGYFFYYGIVIAVLFCVQVYLAAERLEKNPFVWKLQTIAVAIFYFTFSPEIYFGLKAALDFVGGFYKNK